MPFSGDAYSRPSPNPLAIDGVVADAEDFETLMNDIATALTACAKKAVANVFTEVQQITSADAGALYTALTYLLYRNSATPAAADGLGGFVVDGNDSGGNQTRYGGIIVLIADTTDTSEDGVLTLRTVRAGTFTTRVNIGDGIYYQGGADKGAGTANFNGVYSQASVYAHEGTATPAGGTAGAGVLLGSAAVGVFWGSGAPTLSAAKGSLYLRTDGSGTSNRAYINTNGGTTWTALTTAG